MLSGGALGVGYVRHLMGIDPFAGFRRNASNQSDVAIKLNDVELKHYQEGQLISSAHVNELEISRDRQTFDLSGIVDGIYYGEEGRIDFNADEAEWNSHKMQLMVTSGADIAHKDFDLRVPSFTFDRRTTVVSVPKEIVGRFLGGRISAKNFIYTTRDGTYRIGPALWVGGANIGQDGTRSKWTISADGGVRSQRDIEIWENARAADGEIVVQGDKVERNVKTDVITATGNVLYFSQKANLACDKVVVHRKEKRAVLTGNVRMLIKPKDSMEREVKADPAEIPPFRPNVPDQIAASRPASQGSAEEKALDDEIRSGKTTRKYPAVVLADRVEYWYAKGNRRAEISGTPEASQQLTGNRWRKISAPKGVYDGEKEVLRLLGAEGKKDVRVKTSLGDDLVAYWFEFSTKEDDDTWSAGSPQGVVMADDDEIPREKKEEGPPPVEKKEEPPPPSG